MRRFALLLALAGCSREAEEEAARLRSRVAALEVELAAAHAAREAQRLAATAERATFQAGAGDRYTLTATQSVLTRATTLSQHVIGCASPRDAPFGIVFAVEVSGSSEVWVARTGTGADRASDETLACLNDPARLTALQPLLTPMFPDSPRSPAAQVEIPLSYMPAAEEHPLLWAPTPVRVVTRPPEVAAVD